MTTHICPLCGHVFETPDDSPTASEMGRKGGSATSEAKKKASADNLAKARAEGKKGGRPRSDNPVRKRPYHKKEE